MWLLNSTLQEHFNSCVGANMYVNCQNISIISIHWADLFPGSWCTWVWGYVCVMTVWSVLSLQLPHSSPFAGVCPSLWRYWGICSAAGGEEALEAIWTQVRVVESYVSCFSIGDREFFIPPWVGGSSLKVFISSDVHAILCRNDSEVLPRFSSCKWNQILMNETGEHAVL